MKWVNSEHRLPIKSWCENLEDAALKQAVNLANHPVTVNHVALMPDAHVGYGMPIGGVIACSDAIIPNAVGVDIGCGMIATKLTAAPKCITEEKVKKIIGALRPIIPTGFEHHRERQKWDKFDGFKEVGPVTRDLINDAKYQLGTLGGGNHFIEIQAGEDGHIWLMLHSGSRNFGFKIAKYYNRLAIEMCTRWHSSLPPGNGEDSLAFLPMDTQEGRDYLRAMNYALEFAQESRQRMMDHFINMACGILNCTASEPINIHHNFAVFERHFCRDVWIHRKGATQAQKGQLGIIPGSMGTSSYIVRGLGNRDSFMSCSHGAGRKMGRKKFCKTHSVEECTKAMEGIVFGRWSRDRKGQYDISEAPQAYKDIDEVIEAESDLVEIVVKLKPLGVMKG